MHLQELHHPIPHSLSSPTLSLKVLEIPSINSSLEPIHPLQGFLCSPRAWDLFFYTSTRGCATRLSSNSYIAQGTLHLRRELQHGSASSRVVVPTRLTEVPYPGAAGSRYKHTLGILTQSISIFLGNFLKLIQYEKNDSPRWLAPPTQDSIPMLGNLPRYFVYSITPLLCRYIILGRGTTFHGTALYKSKGGCLFKCRLCASMYIYIQSGWKYIYPI